MSSFLSEEVVILQQFQKKEWDAEGVVVWIGWPEVGRAGAEGSREEFPKEGLLLLKHNSPSFPHLDLIGIKQSWVPTSQSPSLDHVNRVHVARCKCGIFTHHYGESLPSGAD